MTQPSTLTDIVAGEVRAQLARRKLTASALADAIGRSEMYVSRRISGNVAFDLADIEQVARFLGVAVADLLPVEERAA